MNTIESMVFEVIRDHLLSIRENKFIKKYVDTLVYFSKILRG